jgi:hypothetical protein
MGYYTRVLTTRKDCVPISVLAGALKKERCRAVIQTEDDPGDWNQAILTHPGGPEIAAIERNPVVEGSLGAEELQEFHDELDGALPRSGAAWLREFFPRVRCIYAFQHLSGTEKKSGFSALSAVRNALWGAAPAVLQADGEGFSNEEGYAILWQFPDSVSGEWWMGTLENGKWVHFQMDRGNREHRRAFLNGEVPAGTRRA